MYRYIGMKEKSYEGRIIMKSKADEILTNIIYTFFAITLIVIVGGNIYEPWLLVILSSFLLMSFSLKKMLLHDKVRDNSLVKVKLGIVFDFLVIFLICRLEHSGIAFLYYLIFLMDIVVNMSTMAAVLSSFGGFFLQLLDLTIRYSYKAEIVVPKALISILAFIGIFLIMNTIKYLLKQNQVIVETVSELRLKTLEQHVTYNELKETYEKLEEMTILKERNKIAREIHDTVGHTLTTVLVEMELGKKLSGRDLPLSLEKYSSAQEQVRKGLNELRESVSVLGKGDDIIDFLPAVNILIKDTEKHTGAQIIANIGQLPNLNNEVNKTLYSALLEGLTNGIKHGESTAFLFKLLHEGDNILFYLTDNGKGCGYVNLGFGLKAMRDRIKELGGSFKIESEAYNGFSIELIVPYAEL
jgi:signal transduction histidine kinase